MDNDMGGGENSFESRWKDAGYDHMQINVDSTNTRLSENGVYNVMVKGVLQGVNAKLPFTTTYALYATGDVIVKHTLEIPDNLPPLPRVGYQLFLKKKINYLKWYGRGPQESYWDRKTGVRVGVYKGSVSEQYVPYPYPQENGNKTDVRWLTLTDLEGRGVLVQGKPHLSVSAHRYTLENLTKATHTIDLKEADYITLNIDYKQAGVGGDDSWNPRTHPEFQLSDSTYTYEFRLKGFVGDPENYIGYWLE